MRELFGDEIFQKNNFTKIVSEGHFKRLTSLLDNGTTFFGGKFEPSKLLIEPTVLVDIAWEDKVMEDEIFGPILPILDYDDLNTIVKQIHSKPKPLALYVFSESNEVQDFILEQISFGGGCINDTVYHLSSPYLPFGGVGESGMGAYHGKGSFDVFSHKKSILSQTTLFDLPFRYPNTKNALKKIKWIIK